MFGTCGRASLKVMMQMVGIDCAPVRRPIDPASPEQIAGLRKGLEEMGGVGCQGLGMMTRLLVIS